jgi:hypothetical protein
MKDLVIIVEGETELDIINKLIIPYIYNQEISSSLLCHPIDMKGGGHGFNNIQHFKNTIYPVLKQKNKPIITTCIDYFKLNSEKKLPGYNESLKFKLVIDRIKFLESKLKEIVDNLQQDNLFIPYIQKYEIETILFANPRLGFQFESQSIIEEVLQITNNYPNIEDINGSENGAPSKRLERIFDNNSQRYKKVTQGIEIAKLTGIDSILEKCPRFKNWVETLIKEIKK